MARKLRLEFPGAIYHVINRGNYRRWVFREERTKLAFQTCLFEACQRSRWVLHAFVVMGNHYHLAVETPQGNLAAGMQWLQATFANRFNRLRAEHGHLFQSRYKSLLVEAGDALSQVCHYIHLNPVRAGMVPSDELSRYRASSYWYIERKNERPAFLTMATALEGAGGLSDTAAGRRAYHDYLAWQSTDGPAGKNKAYVNLSRGWVLGTGAFKQALIADHKLIADSRAWEVRGANEIREQRAGELLQRALHSLGRTAEHLQTAPKSASWKLAIAAYLKTHTDARTRWIANEMAMGAPAALSRNLSRFRCRHRPRDADWRRLMSLSAT